jgi:protein gp37
MKHGMPTRSNIEWTEMTWNPVTGCTKISQGCKHCLAPDTPILYADMSWRPIGDARPGDALVGFDEQLELGHNRAIREAVVEKVWRSTQPAVRLRVGKTEIITTAKHRWLCEPRPWWRTTDRLRIGVRVRVFGNHFSNGKHSANYMSGYIAGMTTGDGTFRFDPSWRSDKLGFPQMYWRVAVADQEIIERLASFLGASGVPVEVRPFHAGGEARKPMWKVETRAKANLQAISDLCLERNSPDWRAGWLGGMFDAEGSHDRNLRISQKDVTLLERGAEYAASFGISTKIERWKRIATLRVEGGAQEKAHFLSVARPVLQRKVEDLFGRRLDAGLAEVTAIELLDEREVVDIQTSTGTFIAAGVCTHNCYAERMARRLEAMGAERYRNGFRVTLHPDLLDAPRRWRQPRVVFVNSMSDLFHEDVPLDYIRRVFATMQDCPQHTFQVLTKRGERLAELAPQLPWPKNVWMGVSVEDARVVDRILHLQTVPAAVRFLSLEPLIGPLDALPLAGIHWVIVGGESGPRARLLRKEWVTTIFRRCRAAGVPFFFKQWGGVRKDLTGRRLNGRTYGEMPAAAQPA